MTDRRSITLRNHLHNSEARVISLDGTISERAMRRARTKLCGLLDCSCGGIQGSQDVRLEPISNSSAWRISEVRKGGRQ